jgi:hypothetical protein
MPTESGGLWIRLCWTDKAAKVSDIGLLAGDTMVDDYRVMLKTKEEEKVSLKVTAAHK